MGAGVVGVAVDDELDACGAGRFGDGAFNDVEVARVLRSLVFGGALPQGLVYDGGALVGGLGEEAFLIGSRSTARRAWRTWSRTHH